MTDWDYTEETVIGHRVSATLEDRADYIQKLYEAIDIEPRNKLPMVRIEVGDVDWDGTQTVRVRLDTLNEMVEELNERYDEK